MNHRQVAGKLAEQLLVDPGWDRPLEHHLRHSQTGVHVQVYGARVEIVFGPGPHGLYDKAVGADTVYTPSTALAALVEVARALVLARQLAYRPVDLAAWSGNEISVQLTDET